MNSVFDASVAIFWLPIYGKPTSRAEAHRQMSDAVAGENTHAGVKQSRI